MFLGSTHKWQRQEVRPYSSTLVPYRALLNDLVDVFFQRVIRAKQDIQVHTHPQPQAQPWHGRHDPRSPAVGLDVLLTST